MSCGWVVYKCPCEDDAFLDFLAFHFSLDKRNTYTQVYESIRINIVLGYIIFLKHTFPVFGYYYAFPNHYSITALLLLHLPHLSTNSLQRPP